MRFPSSWYCQRLHRVIEVSDEALPHPVYGWMCDCVDKKQYSHRIHWLKDSDVGHIVISWRDYPEDVIALPVKDKPVREPSTWDVDKLIPYVPLKRCDSCSNDVAEEDISYTFESGLSVCHSCYQRVDTVEYCKVCDGQHMFSNGVCLGCYNREHDL